MARYQNLKDYLQNEHIKLIDKAVTEHQNSDVDINGNTLIESLYCTDDERSNLKMELVVSADCNNTVSEKQYYNVTLFGSLDRKLQDIQVIDVKKCDKSDIRNDDLLNHFILPDVRTDDLERIGNELFSYYYIFADMKGYGFSLGKIISNMKAPIFFADLPADCLGRINLVEADIKTYRYDIKTQQLKEVSGHAKPGIILLNKKKYYGEQDGELLVTVTHELIHWQFHQKFFKLLVLLGTDSDAMNCKEFPVAFSDSMSDIEKALCIAEWQANALAMRLAIPSCTVDAVNEEIANDPSTFYENYGDRMQACVIKFAKIYGVSCFVAKARMRQLGYDFVDGTILEYEDNGKKIQPAPFYFQPVTLAYDETFVIYRDNYERLLRECKEFAELIKKRYFVYTGYVVCFNHPKYIKLKISHDVIKYELSDYAREHAEECCYKFKYSYISNKNSFTEFDISQYLCRLEDIKININTNEDEDGVDINAKQFKMFFDKMEEDRKKAEKIKAHMVLDDITKFADVLRYHKKRIKGLTYPKIQKEYGIDEDTLKAYVAPEDSKRHRIPSIEHMMLLCHAFRLPHDIAIDFLEKAGTPLKEGIFLHKIYDDLLRLTDTPIKVWDEYLTGNGFSPLFSKGQK